MFKNIYNVLAIISISIILFSKNIEIDNKLLINLPIIWLICYNSSVRNKNRIRYSVRILILISFIRYVISPALISLTGFKELSYTFEYSYSVLEANLMMVLELIGIFWVINKYSEKNEISRLNIKSSYYSFKFKLLYILCLIIIAAHPNIIHNFQFIVLSEETSKPISYFHGFDTRLLIACKYLLYLEIMLYLKSKYIRKSSVMYYYLSILLSFIFVCLIIGDNRLNILVDLIMSNLLLYLIYPLYKKNSKLIFIFLGSFILIYTTIYRLTAVMSWRKHGGVLNFDLLSLSTFINSYFSGISNVAISVDMIRNQQVNDKLVYLANDILAWTGYIGNYLNIDNNQISTAIFNETYYLKYSDWGGYGDKIIPLVGQSRFFFGFLGSPLLSMFMMWWLLKYEDIILKTRNIEKWFIYLFMVIRLWFFLGLNLTIIMMFFLDKFLPLLVVYKLFNFSRRNRN